ncbi:PBSX family phage terminase large subunit [Dyadobacter sp. CY327]|uniref:PBSX family phage terminase large subunit n=1 Tax=Dyadobacter sp. CY327 TaxID=2907301 RepID=UPI001F36E1C2|nr:PBSX family phage terminase large subunit [Dyadobacter sp. CY327]MCE7073682.1 PBSX family phage terminase large subunit [Dyadobacter sp. CY327]
MTNIQIPEAFQDLFTPKRYKVYYGGRGGAKSHNIARALLIQGMQEPLFIVCGREIQKSIKNSVHKLLADIIRKHKLTDFYRILENEIRGINGTVIIFIGLKHNTSDTKSLEGCDRLWIEEAENVSHNTYEVVIPTVRKPGSEIWISFNPKNRTDPTYERHVAGADDRYIVRKVSWRDNPFFPDELNDERLKLQADDPDGYAYVYEGEFDTRRSGAVYAKQLAKAREEGRITLVPYDPGCEVFTAWDLGFGDSTAIWWLQWVGRELRWLDYYENSGEQIGHYAEIIKKREYNYLKEGHFLPHDGGHGNIRGDSVSNQLWDLGVKNQVLTRETDITPGMELLRQTIAYSVFDQNKCRDGIHALEQYGYEWDDERSVFKPKPVHNWTSHASDAARYAAIAAKQVKAGNTAYAPSFQISGSGSFMSA